MKKISLDISATNPNFRESHVVRGIGRYVKQLHSALENIPECKSMLSTFDHCELLKNSKVSKLIDRMPYGKVTLRQQFLYPTTLKSKQFEGIKFLHFPAHMDAAAFLMPKYILSVLDVIYLTLKDLYAPDVANWKFHLARFLEIKAIKKAGHIITISEHSKKDIHRLLNIPLEKIDVTYLGVDSKFYKEPTIEEVVSCKNKFNIPDNKNIILYIGGIDQRKNIPLLVKAVSVLKERAINNKTKLPLLILAGSISSDKNYEALKKQIISLKLEDDVIETGFLSDTEMIALYKIANLFVFLSLYEGFGLPPLEALATGTAVISAKTSCLPEILENYVQYVDVENLNDVVLGIENFFLNNNYSENQKIAGINHAKKFTWEKTAEETFKVYQKVLNNSSK